MIKSENFKDFNTKYKKQVEEIAKHGNIIPVYGLPHKVFERKENGELNQVAEFTEKDTIVNYCNVILAEVSGYEIVYVHQFRKEKNNPHLFPFMSDNDAMLFDKNKNWRWLNHYRPNENWNHLIEVIKKIEELTGMRFDIYSDIQKTYSLAVVIAKELLPQR